MGRSGRGRVSCIGLEKGRIYVPIAFASLVAQALCGGAAGRVGRVAVAGVRTSFARGDDDGACAGCHSGPDQAERGGIASRRRGTRELALHGTPRRVTSRKTGRCGLAGHRQCRGPEWTAAHRPDEHPLRR
jgi:hypothetical protein